MKPSALARLREIVRQERQMPHAGPSEAPSTHRLESAETSPTGSADVDVSSGAASGPRAPAPLVCTSRLQSAAAAFGGEVVDTGAGGCVVVERRYAAGHRLGTLRLGACAEALRPASPGLQVLNGASLIGRAGAAAPLLFLDLETTGLTGGAGTVAFLVGCAHYEGDSLRVRQIVMPEHRHERAVLALVREWVAPGNALVTYNGRTFDVPVLETRFSYHREEPPFDGRPHLDMLPPARRLWRGARPLVSVPGAQSDSCTLSWLERALFGVRRQGDVPGFEIPARYFGFLRTGDAGPLRPVLEHNRLDLISLAALTAHAVRLVERAPLEGTARECLGLARLLERAGDRARAHACFERAARLTEGSWHTDEGWIRAEALRALAVAARRAGCHDEAAAHWQAITEVRICPDPLLREAYEALAIHCEHRARDLDRARQYAERSGHVTRAASYRASLDRRLARLDRKRQHRAPPAASAPFWS